VLALPVLPVCGIRRRGPSGVVAVEEIIDARGDDGNGTVGVRTTMHGVHTGEFFGIAPTGRQTEIRTHDFHQIADGRIVRTHHMEDWLSWFQQVGSWPSS
jgi:predicted ester cyclase